METLPLELKSIIVKFAGNRTRLVSREFNDLVLANAELTLRKAVKLFVLKSRDAKKYVSMFKRNSLRIVLRDAHSKPGELTAVRKFLISTQVDYVKSKFPNVYLVNTSGIGVNETFSSEVADMLLGGDLPSINLDSLDPIVAIASIKFGVFLYKKMLHTMPTLEILNRLSDAAIADIHQND